MGLISKQLTASLLFSSYCQGLKCRIKLVRLTTSVKTSRVVIMPLPKVLGAMTLAAPLMNLISDASPFQTTFQLDASLAAVSYLICYLYFFLGNLLWCTLSAPSAHVFHPLQDEPKSYEVIFLVNVFFFNCWVLLITFGLWVFWVKIKGLWGIIRNVPFHLSQL